MTRPLFAPARAFGLVLAVLLICGVSTLQAQQIKAANYALPAAEAETALPDAPVPTDQSASNQSASNQPVTAGTQTNEGYVQGKQTKRILGVIPNFRSVSSDQKLPPQSTKEKFTTTLQDSFDYSAFIFVGGLAGEAQAAASTPEFHQGAAGYARYYWHTFADEADENIFVEFLLPAALHQDSRYYTLGHGGFIKRASYSISRTLITRTDSDHAAPNYSEVVGAGAASGISDLYYPSDERTWTKTGQRWLTNVILDGVTFEVKEFWPDINDHLFHQRD